MNKVQEALRILKDHNAWRRDNGDTENIVIHKPEVIGKAIDVAISALSDIDKCEPVGELILDPVFLPALKAPLVNWKINLVDLEVGTKFYTSPQPIEKCEPVGYLCKSPDGICVFMDKPVILTNHVNIPLYTSPQPRDCEDWQYFDKANKKAAETSDATDWMNAALLAQQVRRKQLNMKD